jgi:hypothetical protein
MRREGAETLPYRPLGHSLGTPWQAPALKAVAIYRTPKEGARTIPIAPSRRMRENGICQEMAEGPKSHYRN